MCVCVLTRERARRASSAAALVGHACQAALDSAQRSQGCARSAQRSQTASDRPAQGRVRWLIRKVRRRRCRKHSGGVWAAGHKAPKRGCFRSDPLGVPAVCRGPPRTQRVPKGESEVYDEIFLRSVSQCHTRPSMDDGAHALAEHRALHTRHCVRSQGKGITTDKSIVRGAAVGGPPLTAPRAPAARCPSLHWFSPRMRALV